jgi:hypothetical protein
MHKKDNRSTRQTAGQLNLLIQQSGRLAGSNLICDRTARTATLAQASAPFRQPSFFIVSTRFTAAEGHGETSNRIYDEMAKGN